jgi:transcriptional regulator with XRE-family HTH domain
VEAGKRSDRSGTEVFGRLVAVRRTGLGLSQEDLAARIDTSRAHVARIEEGQSTSTETLGQLAAALQVESRTGAPSLRTRIRNLDAEGRRLAIAALIPVLVIVVGALSVVVQNFGGAGRVSGPDDGVPSQQSPQGVSAAPALPPITAGATQGTSRKTKQSQKTKTPDKKRVAPAGAVSEPSLAQAPTTQKQTPAPTQPAREPVASSPPPSSGGGSSNPAPQVHNDPAPQAEHGIGGGEASHGLVPGGG